MESSPGGREDDKIQGGVSKASLLNTDADRKKWTGNQNDEIASGTCSCALQPHQLHLHLNHMLRFLVTFSCQKELH